MKKQATAALAASTSCIKLAEFLFFGGGKLMTKRTLSSLISYYIAIEIGS